MVKIVELTWLVLVICCLTTFARTLHYNFKLDFMHNVLVIVRRDLANEVPLKWRFKNKKKIKYEVPCFLWAPENADHLLPTHNSLDGNNLDLPSALPLIQ